MTNIICPGCKGQREIPVFIEYANGTGGIGMVKCTRCKGIGEVDGDMIVWMAQGEILRHNRIDRGETMREYCGRTGMSVVRLSQLECGIIDNTDALRAAGLLPAKEVTR